MAERFTASPRAIFIMAAKASTVIVAINAQFLRCHRRHA